MIQPRSSSQPPPGGKSVHFNPVISSSSSPSHPKDLEGSISPSYSSSGQNSSSSPSFSSTNYDDDDDDHDHNPSSPPNHHHQHQHHHGRHASQNDDTTTMHSPPSPTLSDTTVDLPPRFDQHGRRRPEKGDDPLADALEDMLSGKGAAGRLFSKFTGGGLGVGAGAGREEDQGRRRKKR